MLIYFFFTAVPIASPKDYSLEVIDFFPSWRFDVEGIPPSRPKYLSQALKNLPYYWSMDANESVHYQNLMENLYTTLLRTQQASIF